MLSCLCMSRLHEDCCPVHAWQIESSTRHADGDWVLCSVFAVVMVAEQVSAAGTRLFTTVLPILRGWLDDAAASHDALGQLLAGNPAIGAPLPGRHTPTQRSCHICVSFIIKMCHSVRCCADCHGVHVMYFPAGSLCMRSVSQARQLHPLSRLPSTR